MRGGNAEIKNFASWLLRDHGLRNEARCGGLRYHDARQFVDVEHREGFMAEENRVSWP